MVVPDAYGIRNCSFVADAPLRFISMHARRSAGDLLGRPAPVLQQVVDVLEQGRAFGELAATHAAATALPVGLRGFRSAVRTAARLQFDHDHSSLFTAQVLVFRSHRNALPLVKCCTWEVSLTGWRKTPSPFVNFPSSDDFDAGSPSQPMSLNPRHLSICTNSGTSSTLSSARLAPGFWMLRAIIRSAANHSARPLAWVVSTSTTKPFRFPAKACVK